MKKICLIALPWQLASGPSPAVGALASFLRHKNRQIRVDCRHDHLEIASRIGKPCYRALTVGGAISRYSDILCFPFFYPKKAETCVKRAARLAEPLMVAQFGSEDEFRSEAGRQLNNIPQEELARAHEILPTQALDPKSAHSLSEIMEMVIWSIMVRVDLCIGNIAREIAGKYDLVGLTTSYNQLSTSLLLCEKLKRISPATVTVLGGALVSGRLGPSIINEYRFIDFIVQGEGEYPLDALVGHLAAKDFEAIERTDGILTPENALDHKDGVELWQVADPDELPFPDYDDYAECVGEGDWTLPIEGSRGCWWDRCRFCNLNSQWEGYRTKSNRRLAAEVEYLCTRYRKSAFIFLDNVHSPKGIQGFAKGLKDTDMDLLFFYELRADLSPYEILALYEAGLDFVQVGIEGLSRSFLKRIRKGTKVIQNLQIMKTLCELEIKSRSNLITDYPRSTRDEVEETCRTIRRYAYAYDPLNLGRYHYYSGSPIDRERDNHPVANVRNDDVYKDAIPGAVLERVELLFKSYDPVGEPVSWSPVAGAIEWWEKLQGYYAAKGQRPMQYRDFRALLIVDYLRSGKRCRLQLPDTERELYLYCTKIRSKKKIMERFSARMGEREINACLEKWISECILYREGEKFLSLAPTINPRFAVRRIRRMAYEDDEAKAP